MDVAGVIGTWVGAAGEAYASAVQQKANIFAESISATSAAEVDAALDAARAEHTRSRLLAKVVVKQQREIEQHTTSPRRGAVGGTSDDRNESQQRAGMVQMRRALSAFHVNSKESLRSALKRWGAKHTKKNESDSSAEIQRLAAQHDVEVRGLVHQLWELREHEASLSSSNKTMSAELEAMREASAAIAEREVGVVDAGCVRELMYKLQMEQLRRADLAQELVAANTAADRKVEVYAGAVGAVAGGTGRRKAQPTLAAEEGSVRSYTCRQQSSQ